MLGSFASAGVPEFKDAVDPNFRRNGFMEHVWSYLGAVVGGNIVGNLVLATIYYFAITPTSRSVDDDGVTLLALSFTGIIIAGIYIGVYSITKGRLVKGAFPVIAVMGAIGVVISIFQTSQSNISPEILIAGSIINYLISVGGFGYFFRDKIFSKTRSVPVDQQLPIQRVGIILPVWAILGLTLAFLLLGFLLLHAMYGFT